MRLYLRIAALSLAAAAAVPAIAAGDSAEGDAAPGYYGAIVRIDESEAEETIASLEAEGVKVLYRRGDLLLTFVPETYASASTETGRKVRGVKRMEIPRRHGRIPERLPNVPSCDFVRDFTGIDGIHGGTGFPQPFDGTGVVCGFCDIGFDTRHLNFLNADGTESRVRKVVKYSDDLGLREEYTTPEEIYAFHTDDADNTHATHVAGIMAGGYRKGNMHGMAPGADIVATMSQLSDVGILAGAEDVIAYAKSVGKPAVINMSVSNYNGPHDGTSLFCQYLDRCAADAVIVLSAGNEGNGNSCLSRSFASDSDVLRFTYANNKWTHFDIYGLTDIYSATSAPFTLNMLVQEGTSGSGAIEFETGYLDFGEGMEYVITSDPEMDGVEGVYHYSADFARHFEGMVALTGGIDPENGRYHVQIFYDCVTSETVSESKPWAKYRLGGMVKAAPGVKVDMYSDAVNSQFALMSGVSPKSGSHNSISDIVTGHKVVSVGMYIGRPVVDQLGGGYSGDPNWHTYDIHSYSSYGTLIDGRVMPLTVAPGANIVSSMSTAYVEAHPGTEVNASYVAEGESAVRRAEGAEGDASGKGISYYWYPSTGTSMASPMVAGAIATWLQAKPDMTSEEVLDIIARTNDSEGYPTSVNPRHGQGYFRPLDGLVEILKNSSTSVGEILGRSVFMEYTRGELLIANPDGKDVVVTLYDVTGREIFRRGVGNDVRIAVPLSGEIRRGSGVVICRVSAGSDGYVTQKLVL